MQRIRQLISSWIHIMQWHAETIDTRAPYSAIHMRADDGRLATSHTLKSSSNKWIVRTKPNIDGAKDNSRVWCVWRHLGWATSMPSSSSHVAWNEQSVYERARELRRTFATVGIFIDSKYDNVNLHWLEDLVGTTTETMFLPKIYLPYHDVMGDQVRVEWWM